MAPSCPSRVPKTSPRARPAAMRTAPQSCGARRRVDGNRIKGHRRVRAGELVPHEWNYRLHPDAQKGALQALYQEVGFARSLLAYELPDGSLKLIDGHLRREIDPDMEGEGEG